MKIDGANFGPCIVFMRSASCENFSSNSPILFLTPFSQTGTVACQSCAAGAIRNICVPTPKLVPIRLLTRDRKPDSIFQDVGEARRQPHLRRRAWEGTEVASQSLQDSDLPFGRMLVRQPRRTRYAHSSEEPGNGTESGAGRETQRPSRIQQ